MLTASPHGTGAYVDPSGGTGIPTGVPASMLARVKGRLNFEDFAGWPVSNRTEKQFLFVATAGSTTTFVSEDPAASDVVSHGLMQWTLQPDPASPKGCVVRTEDAIAADGFDSNRPVLWAARVRMNSPAPDDVNTRFALLGGYIAAAGGSTSDVSDGVDVFFDTTLGVQAWVLRASRAGVAIMSNTILAFDNDFHVVGFLHEGSRVTPFVDGVVLASEALTGPELQPSIPVACSVGRGRVEAAAANALDYSADWCLYGR